MPTSSLRFGFACPQIADFDVSPPPRYLSKEGGEAEAETSKSERDEAVAEALSTARELFSSIATAVSGEFKIPALEYNLLGKMVRTPKPAAFLRFASRRTLSQPPCRHRH